MFLHMSWCSSHPAQTPTGWSRMIKMSFIDVTAGCPAVVSPDRKGKHIQRWGNVWVVVRNQESNLVSNVNSRFPEQISYRKSLTEHKGEVFDFCCTQVHNNKHSDDRKHKKIYCEQETNHRLKYTMSCFLKSSSLWRFWNIQPVNKSTIR